MNGKVFTSRTRIASGYIKGDIMVEDILVKSLSDHVRGTRKNQTELG